MHKFTHINALYQIARFVDMINESERPDEHKFLTPIKFRGTVKLHGCNSGVACTKESLVAQSRNRVLTVDEDHMGFAAFVRQNTDAIREFEQNLRDLHGIQESTKLVLFGEWVGPGIQNVVAINKLPEKQWVLFAAKTIQGDQESYLDVIKPLQDRFRAEGIHSVYDVETWNVTVDFTNKEQREKAAESVEALTLAVEKQCPWAARFGVQGVGEGIVWIPVEDQWGNSDLFWKSKGPKHKEVQESTRNKPMLAPEVLAGVEKFVTFAVTENRLNKGIDYLVEMGHPIEPKSTGHFLKWISQDVERECAIELETNDLKWSQVNKAVSAKAKDFFLAKIRMI
jgi:hypothetical protein